MINSVRFFIVFITLSLLYTCTYDKVENKSSISNSIELTVNDSTGRLDGRKLNFQILENYHSGKLKKIRYSFGDTMLEQSLLHTGFIYLKKTYIKGEPVKEINSNQFEWDYKKLYKVDLIVEQYFGDTLIIWINDDSFVWSEEYVKWKSDFFIWKNHENLEKIKRIKTGFIQDGKDKVQEYIYTKNDIDDIKNLYSNNKQFEEIASIVLGKFEPTDIINIRNAHHFLNEEKKDYDSDLVSLFYDFSLCKSDCFAEKRLRYIGNMLRDVKLDDFWSDNKVEPEKFIQRLNEIFIIMNKEKV